MEGEELSQQANSQSANAAEPNGAGKPSEPRTTGAMTDSQSSYFYNETQKLAQERRAFEAEREEWRQRQVPQQPSQNYQQPQGYQQPQVQQQNPNDPAVFNELVKELGFDAARSIVTSFNQFTQPVQQQLAATQQMVQQAEARSLIADIKARGREQFGSEWSKNEAAVMEKIMRHGISLEDSWAIATAANARQSGIDEAYKTQSQKTAANVAQPTVAPSNSKPVTSNFNDAFESAWSQHVS